MTRILVVTNLYPPHAYGGYGALCEAAVLHWREAGHELAVLTSDVRRPDVAADGNDTDVFRTLPMYWHDHRPASPPLRDRLGFERHTRAVVRSTLDTVRPDVVSVWNLAALSFGLLRYVAQQQVPIVAVIGDRWLTFGPDLDAWSRMFTRRGALGRLAGRAVTATTRLATVPPAHLDMTVLFGSQYLADRAQSTSRFTFTRTALVRHGVDLATFPLAHHRGDRPWAGRLLVVSRLDPRKGLSTTLRAMLHLPEATLDVAGAGEEQHRRELEGLAQDLGIADRVRFLGQVDPSRVRELLLEADAVVFPSAWEEPFGIVPLEALACGAPLVGTGTGGSAEFLRHEVNYLQYPPDSAEALAGAVRRLSSDAGLRTRLRREGLRTAEQLSQGQTLTTLRDWHVAAADGFPHGLPTEHRGVA